MDDIAFGRTIRMTRVRRRLRQQDLADRAGVSRATVSRIERGAVAEVTLAAMRRVAAPLELRIQLDPRGRGAVVDQLVNARHSALHEAVVRWFGHEAPHWLLSSEVSFAIGVERGVIDILAWHAGERALLIIEIKTELADLGALMATADRRLRLAHRIGEERGWHARVVGMWVVVARSRTTQRRIAAHRATLRTAFPHGSAEVRRWLARPDGPLRALSTWAEDAATGPVLRVRRPS